MSRTNRSKNVVSPRSPKAQNSGLTAISTTHMRATIPANFCHQLSLPEFTDSRALEWRTQIQANIARKIRVLAEGCMDQQPGSPTPAPSASSMNGSVIAGFGAFVR